MDEGGCEGYCCNTIGSYYCKCPEGSRLGPDGKACHGKMDIAGMHKYTQTVEGSLHSRGVLYCFMSGQVFLFVWGFFYPRMKMILPGVQNAYAFYNMP